MLHRTAMMASGAFVLAVATLCGSRPGDSECPCQARTPSGGIVSGACVGGRMVEPSLPAEYDTPPRPAAIGKPHYPEAAFEAGIEGVVLLQLTVDVKGKVRDVVVTCSVPELDAAAVECAKGWRFHPARKGNAPVAVVVAAPVEFRTADERCRRECERRRPTPIRPPGVN